MISLRHINKFFQHHQVLNDISLEINQGEIFGIIGGSGAGKSTLLRCINLLERPNSGEVWVNGHNLMELSAEELRKERQKIGMIFQNYQLLSQQTVYENVALPLKIMGLEPKAIEVKCLELLEVVGLSHKQNSYPNQLSGGQKQRVAIARALSTNPRILLCDEATAALDPKNTQAILNLLLDIQKKYHITLVLITHDMQVAKKVCHRIALMKKGHILEVQQWPKVLGDKSSLIRESLYGEVLDQLPEFISQQLSEIPKAHSILRVLFPGQGATIPFISAMCRHLNLDINILSAQIEHSHKNQCGMMLIGMNSNDQQLQEFLQQCQQHHIIGEVIGYVEHLNT
jgi:D-methionine transport system ATP-binding protein